LGIFGNKWEVFLLLDNQFLKLWEAFLELLFGWRILADCTNKLDSVEARLVTLVV
jgi:hypothetical protein